VCPESNGRSNVVTLRSSRRRSIDYGFVAQTSVVQRHFFDPSSPFADHRRHHRARRQRRVDVDGMRNDSSRKAMPCALKSAVGSGRPAGRAGRRDVRTGQMPILGDGSRPNRDRRQRQLDSRHDAEPLLDQRRLPRIRQGDGSAR